MLVIDLKHSPDGPFGYLLSFFNSFLFQDLNIPVPQPITLNEPNAKRARVDSSDNSSNSTIDGTKVFALPNGTVPCNKPLSDLIHLVKPHIRELVEDSNLVSTFKNPFFSKLC